MAADLKNNPALGKEAMAKALADAHEELTLPDLKAEIGKLRVDMSDMPDAAALHDRIAQGLAGSGLSADGKMSPELQQKMTDAMDKAKERLQHSLEELTLPDGSGLQPY